jgi:hypothetical protein
MVPSAAVVSTAVVTASAGPGPVPSGDCRRPLHRQDALALAELLDLLKEQLLLGRLDPDLVRRLTERLPDGLATGVDGLAADGTGAVGQPSTPPWPDEDRLVQALDGVAQRVRFALAEYDEPPGSARPQP